MDDEDEDPHHPYHQLHHLYDQAAAYDYEEDDEEEEDEEGDDNMDDGDEDEEDDLQEHPVYPQDFDLDSDHKRNSDILNVNDALCGSSLVLHRPNEVFEGTAGGIEARQDGLVGGAIDGGMGEPRRDIVQAAEARRESGIPAAVGATGGGRDDWTEDATHVLLEAWGEKYMSVNKGNLKQEDWEQVAQVVTSVSKSHKTDVQCKNRLDTLKKKYKIEKHKQSAIGSLDSKWPFYKRLDQLLSATSKRLGIPGAVDAGVIVKSSLDREDSVRNFRRKYEDDEGRTSQNSMSSSKSKGSAEMTCNSSRDGCEGTGTLTSRKRKAMDSSFKILVRAITRFGEIYEKMEQSKQQQLMDLEKIRMEFTRDLELQRMQLFMQTQMELAKMKHGTNDIDPALSS